MYVCMVEAEKAVRVEDNSLTIQDKIKVVTLLCVRAYSPPLPSLPPSLVFA